MKQVAIRFVIPHHASPAPRPRGASPSRLLEDAASVQATPAMYVDWKGVCIFGG